MEKQVKKRLAINGRFSHTSPPARRDNNIVINCRRTIRLLTYVLLAQCFFRTVYTRTRIYTRYTYDYYIINIAYCCIRTHIILYIVAMIIHRTYYNGVCLVFFSLQQFVSCTASFYFPTSVACRTHHVAPSSSSLNRSKN